jgi:hypothetical protein
MFGFSEARAAVEAEGVYIGGWSLKNAVTRQKDAGEYTITRGYVTSIMLTTAVQLKRKSNR